ILVLVWNPKDTAVSHYRFYNNMPVLLAFASWDEYFAAFMNDSLLCWAFHQMLAPCHSHDVKSFVFTSVLCSFGQDQVLGMKRIAAFFGFSLCEEDFPRIAKKTAFQAMKEK
ncbi:Sulfotransferase 6B1, partial [Gavia stellata]